MNTVFLFSGQGSQYSGMGKELVDAFPQLGDIYKTASEILSLDLKEICFNGTNEKLSETIISQPAIMATSLVMYEAAKMQGITASAVAGHSLGEYAAMVAGGMLSVEDGFKVIKARASAMQKAATENPGAMCAVMGKTPAEIEEICNEIDDYVVPVNYNSPAQTVIAGTETGIEKAIGVFGEKGAKIIKLNVRAAFHSKLMQSAADEFLSEIKGIKFNAPSVKFFSNVYGDELTDFTNMPELLAKHIVSPVKFTAELEKLYALGYTNYIECGPNKVLTGLVKKTLKDVNAVNIENLATLEKAVASLNA